MLPLFDKIPYSDGKNGNGHSDIPAAIREYVFHRDKRKCRYCGRAFDYMTIDHVYPKKYGGKSIPENLVTACIECNTRKGAKIGMWPLPIDFFDNASRVWDNTMRLSALAYQTENTLSWYYRLRRIGIYAGLLAMVVSLFYVAMLFINFNAALQFSNFFVVVTAPPYFLAMASLPATGFLNNKLLSLVEKIKDEKG